MMAKCHASHIGIEGCLRRARESMFWPRMSSDIKEYIAKCDVCLAHQNAPQRESIIQHETTARPWAKIGVDLCDFQGRTLLVVCDYFSGFIEVERLQSTTSSAVSKVLRVLFARYGIPNELVSDNGPQFAAAEFATFARNWGFHHVTSSPRYPQSNGKAENAVKTIKRLFSKCKEAGQSEFLALLDWRNTPTEGLGSSPAQRFLGRRCRTQLPVTETLLRPAYDTEADARALKGKREKQALYYNRHTRDLPPLQAGETVRMQLPGEKRWTPGTCTGLQGPRSYGIRVGESEFRRNRRQILRGGEPQPTDYPEQDTHGLFTPGVSRESTEDSSMNDPSTPQSVASPTVGPETDPDPPLRRSTRQRRQPEWITSYVPS